MARRYVRDSKGRFASTGGSGSSRIRSQFAANTRLAGKYEQAMKKEGDWELSKPNLPVRGVAPTRSTRRTSGRMSNAYRGDVAGLRSDLNIMTRNAQGRAMDRLTRDVARGRAPNPKSEAQAARMLQRRLRREMKWSSLL